MASLLQRERDGAFFESGYGIMNEHQVAIGESTCTARFWSAPATAGGLARIEHGKTLVPPGGTNSSVGGTNSNTNGIKRKYPPTFIIDTHLINY